MTTPEQAIRSALKYIGHQYVEDQHSTVHIFHSTLSQDISVKDSATAAIAATHTLKRACQPRTTKATVFKATDGVLSLYVSPCEVHYSNVLVKYTANTVFVVLQTVLTLGLGLTADDVRVGAHRCLDCSSETERKRKRRKEGSKIRQVVINMLGIGYISCDAVLILYTWCHGSLRPETIGGIDKEPTYDGG